MHGCAPLSVGNGLVCRPSLTLDAKSTFHVFLTIFKRFLNAFAAGESFKLVFHVGAHVIQRLLDCHLPAS